MRTGGGILDLEAPAEGAAPVVPEGVRGQRNLVDLPLIGSISSLSIQAGTPAQGKGKTRGDRAREGVWEGAQT